MSRKYARMILVSALVLFSAFVLACGQATETAESTGSGEEESYEDKMAEEHKDDNAEPSPAAAMEPKVPVEASEVVYGNVDGNDATGYLARPAEAEGDLPAVLVIHEWWGLNDNIRAMARQLAGEGYVALAVDLYGGQSADEREGAYALMSKVGENPEPAKENLRQAHAYLKSEHGATRVGSIGWCFGGGWSLQTGLLLAGDVHATVIYYGRLVTDQEQLAALQAPVLGIFGALDGGIPVETVREFEAALNELGKDAAVHVYDGADHAFANPSGTRYHEEAATDAWAKTLAFLEANLKI